MIEQSYKKRYCGKRPFIYKIVTNRVARYKKTKLLRKKEKLLV